MLKYKPKNRQAGFTLTEIVVAASIFAMVVAGMMAIFVLTLKINRKTDSIRQASQGGRNFIEFLVKEVRNGHIDYGVQNGTVALPEVSPCPYPFDNGALNTVKYGRIRGNNNEGVSDWALGIINLNGERECFYWSRNTGDGTQPTPPQSGDFADYDSLFLRKEGVSQVQQLNPPNFKIDFLRFYVRPNRDPYASPPPGQSLPKIQPSVTIIMQFTSKLPTGETVTVPYQTTISTNNYDIPAN